MYRRAPMSRDLGSLVARSILTSLDHAENYPKLDGPSGAFKRDLDAIADAPEDARQVRARLHGTLVSTVGVFLAHAVDHIRALANDMLRDPLAIWYGGLSNPSSTGASRAIIRAIGAASARGAPGHTSCNQQVRWFEFADQRPRATGVVEHGSLCVSLETGDHRSARTARGRCEASARLAHPRWYAGFLSRVWVRSAVTC